MKPTTIRILLTSLYVGPVGIAAAIPSGELLYAWIDPSSTCWLSDVDGKFILPTELTAPFAILVGLCWTVLGSFLFVLLRRKLSLSAKGWLITTAACAACILAAYICADVGPKLYLAIYRAGC